MVVGYPLGGEQISVTAGVVSRIDYGMYSHSTRDHLVLQTDSAINSGNSGGPCFDVQTSKVVGVAFQSLSDAENVGYVVPVDILKHVLEDYRRTGKYNGFGRIGFLYQNLENKHLKSYFGLPAGAGGILISRVSPVSPLNGVVREKDVLIALDDQPIADDGTVAFPGRSEERISFGYLLTYKFIGDSVKLSLIREGKPLTVSVPVTDVPDLVPHSLHDRKPSYIVHAGLVMTALTEPYLAVSARACACVLTTTALTHQGCAFLVGGISSRLPCLPPPRVFLEPAYLACRVCTARSGTHEGPCGWCTTCTTACWTPPGSRL